MDDLIEELAEAMAEDPALFPEALKMMSEFAGVQRGLCDDDETNRMLKRAESELSDLANLLDGEMDYCDD